MQKEFKDRKHRIKIVILKDHSVYRMENRLEGGRSGCAETNLEATAGLREGWCSLEEGAVKTQGGWEVGVQSSLGGKIDSVWWLGLQEREASGRCFRFWLAQLDEEWGHSRRGKTSGERTYFLHSSTRLCDSPILGAILLCECLIIAVSKGVGVTLLGNDKMAALSFLPLMDPALLPGKWLTRAHSSTWREWASRQLFWRQNLSPFFPSSLCKKFILFLEFHIPQNPGSPKDGWK